jgi:hypothetical protein
VAAVPWSIGSGDCRGRMSMEGRRENDCLLSRRLSSLASADAQGPQTAVLHDSVVFSSLQALARCNRNLISNCASPASVIQPGNCRQHAPRPSLGYL